MPTPDSDQRHLGIIHSSLDARQDRYFHFFWHYNLRNDTPQDGMAIVKPRIGKRVQVQLAAYCRLIWDKNGKNKIPYGFGIPENVFDREGNYIPGRQGQGLTCSTLVLAIFDAKRIPLVQYLTWPRDRQEDWQWQIDISKTFVENDVGDGRGDTMTNDIGSPRYRPEEVAAASLLAPPHAHFHQVEPVSLTILEELKAWNQ